MKSTALAVLPLAFVMATATPAIAADTNGGTPVDTTGKPVWATGSAKEAARLRRLLQGLADAATGNSGQGSAPSIPRALTGRNAAGVAATFLPQGSIPSSVIQPFFTALGSNPRICQTCHEPNAGWSITPQRIKALYQSDPAAPLFQMVDGASCPTADTSTPQAAAAAFKLLLDKGLIRVFIPLPTPDILQFSITNVNDPYDCTSNPSTGLTGPTSGMVSEYRRSLPSANLPFMSTLMWDGREPSLASQAGDAVMIHAQGSAPPDAGQVDQIVRFESSLFAAQSYDNAAGDLTTDGAQGGPTALSATAFSPGVNAPGAGFNPDVMTMFLGWNNNADSNKASIARGQNIFNEKSFAITGVAGLNDVADKPTVQSTCSGCHNTPGIGNHSSAELLDLGIANAPGSIPGGAPLDVADLPVFTVHCDTGPSAGTDRQVTDLGRALITGQCADLGKVKTALLRDLAARPPYFHNGSAPDLAAVVDFYDKRFSIGFTDQEKTDLAAFLSSL